MRPARFVGTRFMTAQTWLEFLASRGARTGDAGTLDFGDPPAELAAARSASVLVPLVHLGLLEFSGADARAFLHAQLSCDVANLAAGRSVFGCYCTPKGRMLANFLLWAEGAAFRMLLARDILPAIRKRLQMFVLRSKVAIADPGEALALCGASGPAAEGALRDALGAAPAQAHDVAASAAATVVRLPGARFVIAFAGESRATAWDALARRLRPAGPAAWQWLEIVHGMPVITAATQDQFVPQMANLELLGGVSFRKGCYPGQEIVARTQHLGKVKRRMYLAHAAGTPPGAGEPVFAAGDAEAQGMVVNAAPAPDGGTDVLAVLQTASAASGELRLQRPDGPRLELRPLPYPVE